MKEKGLVRHMFTYKNIRNIPYVFRKQKEYHELSYKYGIISGNYIFSKGLTNIKIGDPENIENFSDRIKSRIPDLVEDEMSKKILNSSIEEVKYLLQRREAQKNIAEEKLNSRQIKANNSLHESSIKFIESLNKQVKWALDKIEELEDWMKPEEAK